LAKAKVKRKQQNVINLEEQRHIKRHRKQEVSIIPKNTAQEDYIDKLNNDENRLVFAVGPAGTGKTLLATLKAIKELRDGNIERIIITRPAVSVDEQHGFLPGDLNQKMEPWVAPLMDVFDEYFSPDELTHMIRDKVIEIAPLAYMRGRNFKDSIVLLDEAQLTTPNQLKMAMTRVNETSRMFITGDLNQSDQGKDGLEHFTKLINAYGNARGIAITQFENKHVERSEIVKTILNIYGDSII